MREDQGRAAPSGESDWLTLGRAARYLGVAQSTIRKWSDSGRVRAFKTPGGHRRYRRADLDAFLNGSAPESRSGPVVLIVDDDERLREYVRVNLEMEGYTIHEAASADDGHEGARRAAARPRAARRDDAAGGRLGDAAADARTARRGLDPGRDVQRQGRPAGGRPGGRARRAGLHRQAVRPERADRADETAPARPDSARPPPPALGRPPSCRLAESARRRFHPDRDRRAAVRARGRGARVALAAALVPGLCWWRPTSLRTGSRSSCASGSAGCARRSSIPTRGRSWPRRTPARSRPATRRAPLPARP